MRVCVCVFKEGNLHTESSLSTDESVCVSVCVCVYVWELVFFRYVGYAAVTNLECVLISLSH